MGDICGYSYTGKRDGISRTSCGTSIARMKVLARMHVWWPGITDGIEEAIRGCTECKMNQSTPPAAPLHLWSGQRGHG